MTIIMSVTIISIMTTKILSFWATICKMVHRILSDHRLSCLSATLVYCGQTVGRIKMPLGLGSGYIVLDGEPTPLPRKGHSSPSLFGPCILWPNGRPSQQLLSSDTRLVHRVVCPFIPQPSLILIVPTQKGWPG